MSEADPLRELNDAKELAWQHARDAVAFLASIMADNEQDIPDRCYAAAELLQFAVKGP